ncbi:efflux transporter outer membrane subunit [Ramlibacter sp.]|uniref:efflux transporter outer membrane subunit n=1 Tax=Ramlibacter sp. TaxID=1917967 RepID=UPI002628A9F0|nr:efflux transporter outer membrane subunit [Ramlibacter sp.]MDB5953444.1 transporter [Ramlibacter sp.]
MSIRFLSIALLSAASLAACSSGPDYVRPRIELPAAFKESGPWKPAQPQLPDARQPWWEVFADPDLNRLESEANGANQTLRQLEAVYRQARAQVAIERSAFWPTAGLNASASRGRSGTASSATSAGNSFALSLGASWEPDLWGSVARTVESASASAEASADDLAGARLSVQTQLASDYLALRVNDVLSDLYAETTAGYAKALQLTQSQYRAGTVLHSDVALAESTLKAAQAQAADLDATRAQLEHAIATLAGHPASTFDLPRRRMTLAQLRSSLPAIPVGVPSQLLERRPDVAAAERRAAAANAAIGVAQAAFFPSLLLSASGGGAGATLARLFDTPGRVWSLGAALAQTVFDGGLRSARRDQAEAGLDAAAAAYKATVLSGLQQVEDNLAILRVLDQEGVLQEDAVSSAQVAEQSALRQYRGGTGTYLAVITAQNLALTNERTSAQILGRQLTAAVTLITGLGGGWTATPVAHTGAAPASTSAAAEIH